MKTKIRTLKITRFQKAIHINVERSHSWILMMARWLKLALVFGKSMTKGTFKRSMTGVLVSMVSSSQVRKMKDILAWVIQRMLSYSLSSWTLIKIHRKGPFRSLVGRLIPTFCFPNTLIMLIIPSRVYWIVEISWKELIW